MNDYHQLDFTLSPCTTDATDLLAAFLADEGFESFVPSDTGLQAFIPADAYSKEAVSRVLGEFPMDCKVDFTDTLVEGRDWNEEWEKNYFKPIVVGNRVAVHSSFHKDVPQAEFDIVIDPRMAFGTGHHATTSMMMRHLLDLPLAGATVTDMGTGTGILAILAMMAGAASAAGIEIDPAAADNAADNVSLNNVDVTLLCGDSSRLPELPPADIFLANINRNVILADLSRYAAALKSGGTMVLSGFYQADVPLVSRAAEACGLIPELTLNDGDWASIRARSLKIAERSGGDFEADSAGFRGSDAGIVTDEFPRNMPKSAGQ